MGRPTHSRGQLGLERVTRSPVAQSVAGEVVGADQLGLLVRAVHLVEEAVAHRRMGIVVARCSNRVQRRKRSPGGGQEGGNSACWGEVDDQGDRGREVQLGRRVLGDDLDAHRIGGGDVGEAVPELDLSLVEEQRQRAHNVAVVDQPGVVDDVVGVDSGGRDVQDDVVVHVYGLVDVVGVHGDRRLHHRGGGGCDGHGGGGRPRVLAGLEREYLYLSRNQVPGGVGGGRHRIVEDQRRARRVVAGGAAQLEDAAPD